MAESIDALQIEINAKASKANDAIDRLVGKLDRLTTSLGRINGTNLNGLANGVQRLGNAMQTMNTIKTADFTRLATNLSRLGSINVSALNSAASSMSHLTRAFNNLGTVSASTQSISQLVNSLSRLGGVNVQRAIANIPQLATAMNNLMTTLSRSPRISANVIQMTNALANLANQGSRVGTASRSLINGLNNSSAAANRAKKSFGGLAAVFGKFYASYYWAVRGIKGLFKSIEGTADYIEAYNYFNVAMGKIGSDWSYQYEKYGYDNAEEYSKSFEKRLSESLGKLSGLNIEIGADGKGLLTETGMKNLGLNIQEITQYASQLASITNSVGQTGETSLAAAKSFTRLAGDISSLFNIDYKTAANNLQSGLIGQSRALYKYGIDITNATLQTYAYDLGLSKAVSEMTQAEKMQLRMIAILDQSKVSWGDLANTINSPSNMLRQFKNNLKENAMVLGQLFIPLLQKAMPVINGVTIAIKRMLVNIAGMMGIKLDLDAFGKGYSDLEEDIDGVSDALDDVSNSAKKATGSLSKLDELNVINLPTSSKNTGAGSSFDLTDEITAMSDEYEKAWNEAYEQMENKSQEFADKFTKIFELPAKQIGERLSNSLSNALAYIDWNGIYQGAENFGTGFANFLNGFITPGLFGNLGKAIANSLNAAIYTTLSYLKTFDFNNFGESLASGINEFFRIFKFDKLAKTVNSLIKGIYTAFSTTLRKVNWRNIGNQIGVFLSNVDWINILAKVSSAIIQAFITVLKTGFGTLQTAPIETAIIGAFLLMKFNGLDKIIATKIGTKFLSVSTLMSTSISQFSAKIGTLLTTDLTIMSETVAMSAGTQLALGLTSMLGMVIAAVGGYEFGSKFLRALDLDGNGKTLGDWLDRTYAQLTGWGDVFDYIAEREENLKAVSTEVLTEEIFGGPINKIKESWDKVSESIDNTLTSSQNYVSIAGEAEARMAKTLADKYYELADKQNLSNDEHLKMQEYAKQLQELLPNVSVEIDKETGLITTQKDEIYKTIEAQKEYYKVQAMKDKIIELYKQQIDAEDKLGDMTSQLSEAQATLNGYQTKANAEIEKYGQATYDTASKLNTARIAVNELKTSYDGVKDSIQKSEEQIDKWTESIAKGTSELPKEAKESGANYIEGFTNAINSDTSTEKAVGDWTQNDIVDPMYEGLDEHSPSKVSYSAGEFFVEGFNNAIEDKTSSSVSTISIYINSIVDKFNTLNDSLYDIGINAMRGLHNGMSSVEKDVYSKADEIARNIANTVQKALDIHSPSRVMFKLGGYTIGGYKEGMESLYKQTISSLKSFTSDIEVAPIPTAKMLGTSNSPKIDTSGYEQYSNSYRENAETNALLRRLINAVESGRVIEIDGQQVFEVTRDYARDYSIKNGRPAYDF